MSRRLTKSRRDTIIAGVAAGLAEYLNTDPALVRIAWAILVPLTGGAALLAYIVGWVVIPEAPSSASDTTSPQEADKGEPAMAEPDEEDAADAGGAGDRAGIIVGVGLILLGAWFLAAQYLPQIDWGLVWPLVLVGIGGVILVNATRNRG